MQERELMKAGISGANEQDDKQQLGGRPRFIRPQNNMNTDTTNNSGINITSSNPNNSSCDPNTNTSSNTTTQPPALRCPRCDSANTKFCYYNNYSLLQPRYFCKSCRRYWTKGGALRNVPVGGGCRKNKRITTRQRIGGPSELMSSSSSSSFLSHPHLADHHPAPFSPYGDQGMDAARHAASFSFLNNPQDPAAPPNLLYFNLPSNDPLMKDNPLLNQPLFPPSIPHELQSPSSGLFSRQLASYLPSSVASQYLSNVGSLPLHNFQGYHHDFLPSNSASAADHQQLIQHRALSDSMSLTPTPAGMAASATHPGMGPTSLKAFSLPFDDLSTGDHNDHNNDQHWASSKIVPHEQKLLADQKLHHMGSPAMDNQASTQEGPSRLYTHPRSHTLHSPKVEEGWPPQQHNQGAAPSSGFHSAGNQGGTNYWTSGGWNDMPGYNQGADHPFM